jgi:hypothetical protein
MLLALGLYGPVFGVAPSVTALLSAPPGLMVVATSGVLLLLAGEHVYQVRGHHAAQPGP